MTPDPLQALEAEITRFRTWADAYPVAQRSGEWEVDYDDWPRPYAAFTAFVTSLPCQQWDDAATQMVLYAIARDNEIGHLLQEIRKNLSDFLCLAERAVTSPETHAKSQVAAELGRVGPVTPQVEALLLRFAHDDDEYVRRLAMCALADIGSPHVVELVEPAWETGDEYQRMAALYALGKSGSPQLDSYLARAEADGRKYLVAYAADIRAGIADYMMPVALSHLFYESGGAPIEVDGQLVHRRFQWQVPGWTEVRVKRLRHNVMVAQGLRVKSGKVELEFNSQRLRDLIIWANATPDECVFRVIGRQGAMLKFWNVWRSRDGVQIHEASGNAGMLIEEMADGLKLSCSDGVGKPDFQDLVLQITFHRGLPE